MADLIQRICTQNDCVKQGSKLEGLKYLADSKFTK